MNLTEGLFLLLGALIAGGASWLAVGSQLRVAEKRAKRESALQMGLEFWRDTLRTAETVQSKTGQRFRMLPPEAYVFQLTLLMNIVEKHAKGKLDVRDAVNQYYDELAIMSDEFWIRSKEQSDRNNPIDE